MTISTMARLSAFSPVSIIVTATLWTTAGAVSAQTAGVTAEAAPTAAPTPVSPEPPAAVPGPDAPVAPAESAPSVASAPTPPPDITARLDELDQIARITARRHELWEEEAEKRAKETSVTTIDDKGLSIRSADGSYVLRVRGLLQVDGRFFLGDDVLQDKDTFLIRRFRPTLEGTLFGLVDHRFVPDFAGGVAQIMDAYVDVHPRAFLRLRVGKMKAPIGLERLQSDADLPLVERALDSNLSTTRDIGAQLWGDVGGGIVNYSVGVYDGGLDGGNADLDTNHAKDFIGRLFFQPLKTESLAAFGNLGIGIAASTGNRKGLPSVGTTAAVPGLPSFRTSGQNTFFSYLAPGSDPSGTGITFAYLRASRLNPQLYYYVGRFGLLGEYILSRQEVQRGNAPQATLTHQAAHVGATCVLNGKLGYDGVTPLVPFDPAKAAWGALELAARWSWLRVDSHAFVPNPTIAGDVSYADPLKSARVAQSWAFGINWVPRRSFKLAFNFEQTRFTGGSGAADKTTVANRPTENTLLARTQVNF